MLLHSAWVASVGFSLGGGGWFLSGVNVIVKGVCPRFCFCIGLLDGWFVCQQDLRSLDFTFNRLFIKLFKTNSVDVVKAC